MSKQQSPKNEGVDRSEPVDTGDTGQQPRSSAGRRLLIRLRNNFLAGILVTAPITITFWLAWKGITLVDNRITPLIPPQWNPETYLPFGVPGLGLIVVFVGLTLIGFFAAGYAGRMFTSVSSRLVARLPIARSVYSWTRQVFETVLSQRSTAFREVVLVEYPNRGTWAVGFITGRTEGEVQDLTEAVVYNVFVPATPNPTTGFLLFIPEKDVHHLEMTVEEGIKLVISGGIVEPPKNRRQAAAAQSEAINGGTDEEATLVETTPPKISFLGRLRNYFFAGVLVTAPIGITIWLAWGFVSFVDNRVTPLIPPGWNPETYLPFSIPGLGVLLVVIVLIIIGSLTAGLLGRSFVSLSEQMLARMPVIRGIYAVVKQVIETVFKRQSRAFREVVLIEYPRRESWAIGFITGQTEGHIQEITPDSVVNVFLPTTPNPTSGFLLFVRKTETTSLSMTIEEGIKMVISGGIVTPADHRKPKSAEKEMAKSA